MEVKILDKSQENIWDDFVKNHPLASIHQCSRWGHFQESIPSRGKYWIVAIFDGEKIIGGSMIIRHRIGKKHCWLYSARGPLLDYKNAQKQMDALLVILKKIAKEQKAIFYRIDPPITEKYKFKGFSETSHGFQPDNTLILDLTQTQEQLLSEMKPKGRYNIKLAEKKGVTVEKSKDIASFYKILIETTTRDGFSPHNQKYYENMLNNLPENAILYIAKHNNEPVAGLINTNFTDTATYYFGASSNEKRDLMAPYLLQWTAITEAKDNGLKYYDFLGISPENAENHPWKGVSEFKLKFGGTRQSYQKAKEYSFSTILHILYKIYKRFR